MAVMANAGIPWRRGVAWLLFLGPFFFLSYGYTNAVAANRAVTDAMYFEWERQIPFLPWTILPYWSIDAFYGLSFLLCRTALEVDRHALRLLTAQLISISCFLLFPLRFAFERPLTDGIFGAMFDALMGFDKPYNQAPSLHIGLLVILWARFAAATTGHMKWVVHAWATLIGLSVLTTYQHHFIDLPTGALAGLLCLWLWPMEGKPLLAAWRLATDPKRMSLACGYLTAAAALASAGFLLGNSALLLCWAGIALAMVGLCYAGIGAAGFQKQMGQPGFAAQSLLAPYLWGAWLNSRWWTRHHPTPDRIADGVWLGRMPTIDDMRNGSFEALLDLTAELPAPQGRWAYTNLPWLDLAVPDEEQLRQAAHHIERMSSVATLLVCCALGYSRSATAVAAWLLLSGRASTVEEAETAIRAQRPGVVFSEAHRRVLAALVPPPEGAALA